MPEPIKRVSLNTLSRTGDLDFRTMLNTDNLQKKLKRTPLFNPEMKSLSSSFGVQANDSGAQAATPFN